MPKVDFRDMLLRAGVKNLQQFGYPDVDKTNILTDMIYKAFFHRMLEDDENKTDVPGFEAAKQVLLEETQPAAEPEKKLVRKGRKKK